MKKFALSALVVAGSTLGAAMALRTCHFGHETLEARIDRSVASHVKPGEPGYAVLVVKDGQSVYRKAFGLADVAHRTPLSPDMRFQIGSITKQFTAVAVMMLVEEGKLHLGDDLGHLLPDYPAQGRGITVEELLACTSGIPDFTIFPDWRARMGERLTPLQMRGRFQDLPLMFAPGSRWFYSNSGYLLLQLIVEKISGQPFGAFLQSRIFGPCGMHQTTFGDGESPGLAEMAHGYEQDRSKVNPAPMCSLDQVGAAGGIVSTVDDLAQWNAHLHSGKLIRLEDLARLREPAAPVASKNPTFTHGWARFGEGKEHWYGAVGGIDSGFTTFALDIPEHQTYVVVLTNSTDPRANIQKLGLALGRESVGPL